MLQDLAFGHLDNQYQNHTPQKGDVVGCIRGGSILIARDKQDVLTLMPRYYVFVDGQQVAEIVKAFTLFRPKYRIDGLGWEIEGEFTHHNYLITKHDQTIVSIDKEWMTWGDCYELNIKNDTDEIVALAVVLTIDCVTESSSSGVSISFDL